MSSAIEIRNLTKRYNDLTILDDISFSIEPSEFIVFLGPSGCGKSTLLRMIAGLESISDGEIWMDQNRLDVLPPGKRDVSMVFQNYALYPHMTVEDNMAFGLKNIGTDPDVIRTRIKSAAEMLEMTHLLKRKPAELSGGQRQRVAIGRAIVREPKAFLFDEPLSNLDAALRGRTRIELAQLHQRVKATMIFVTHDQVEAMTLADRIVVLNNTRIEQIGTPIDIYQRPASKFVAGFVGTPAMNFVNVAALTNDGGTTTVQIDGMKPIDTSIAYAKLPDPQGCFELGVRAEDIDLVDEAEAEVSGTVSFVERLGERTLLYVRLADGRMLIADTDGKSQISAGETVHLKMNKVSVHLFDANGVAYHGEE
ncbi:ABC transporter related [Tolumonas auensis DSM 9187]|uniref:ABC transporter related n=1 Tax=Tolumonas auensis (strain DSM 9187 / NBRC 110442 / TA 4) TaxID=595494 RepID=C4LFF5_TOLAT|nr:sn-glycerol-3-phosphate ABC transporter ATP-binding protein UgpC [Tolumonas auensis]ACQ93322.1 ABC transporter related [Tolumonas auensis DSM 9187]